MFGDTASIMLQQKAMVGVHRSRVQRFTVRDKLAQQPKVHGTNVGFPRSVGKKSQVSGWDLIKSALLA